MCVQHMLPELHRCPGLIRGPSAEGAWFKRVEGPSIAMSAPPKRPLFAPGEAKDLAYSVVALTVAFTVLKLRWVVAVSPVAALWLALGVAPLALLAVVTAFVLHELAHRSMARRMGYWAEYRAWPLGLILAVATSFLGFLFAAPGAVYVEGAVDRRGYGVIALAGPMTNLAVACVVRALLSLAPPLGALGRVLWFIGDINLWLGVFNLLPIPPLDGFKVASWSLAAWALPMALGVGLLVL